MIFWDEISNITCFLDFSSLLLPALVIIVLSIYTCSIIFCYIVQIVLKIPESVKLKWIDAFTSLNFWYKYEANISFISLKIDISNFIASSFHYDNQKSTSPNGCVKISHKPKCWTAEIVPDFHVIRLIFLNYRLKCLGNPTDVLLYEKRVSRIQEILFLVNIERR